MLDKKSIKKGIAKCRIKRQTVDMVMDSDYLYRIVREGDMFGEECLYHLDSNYISERLSGAHAKLNQNLTVSILYKAIEAFPEFK